MNNIETTRQHCQRECQYTYWRHDGIPKPGDVRRCEHGKVWMSTGSETLRLNDLWERLTWWSTPVLYRRALKALAVAS